MSFGLITFYIIGSATLIYFQEHKKQKLKIQNQFYIEQCEKSEFVNQLIQFYKTSNHQRYFISIAELIDLKKQIYLNFFGYQKIRWDNLFETDCYLNCIKKGFELCGQDCRTWPRTTFLDFHIKTYWLWMKQNPHCYMAHAIFIHDGWVYEASLNEFTMTKRPLDEEFIRQLKLKYEVICQFAPRIQHKYMRNRNDKWNWSDIIKRSDIKKNPSFELKHIQVHYQSWNWNNTINHACKLTK